MIGFLDPKDKEVLNSCKGITYTDLAHFKDTFLKDLNSTYDIYSVNDSPQNK